MSFDPKRHMIKVQGNREYLTVSGRLIWFREDHPDWGIVTQAIEINLSPDNNKPAYAIFQATIINSEGKVMATATKMEDQRGFNDFIEKAETGSVGRALTYCGYGTQSSSELEESGRPSGNNMSANRFAGGNNRPPMGGNGNGFNRPAPPQRSAPQQMPQRNAPPPPVSIPDEDDVFGDEAAPPISSAPPQRMAPPQSAPVQSAPAPVPTPERQEAAPQRPASPSAGITRVREPERETFDPSDMDDDEGDDPFADDDLELAPAPRAETATPVAPTRPEKVNALAGNNCSIDGCSNVLTTSQMTMSMNKFGKPLCLLHQRDAVPSGAAAGPSNGNSSGNGRRSATKSNTPTDSLL